MSEPAYTTESRPLDRNTRAGLVAAARGSAKKTSTTSARPSSAPPVAVVQVLAHPEHPEITHQIELITPSVAEHYLSKRPEWQRNESLKTTDEYTDDMADGDWLYAGDPIRFTVDDELFDGQHRCQAIYTSGRAQWALVIRGLPREVMRVLDTGYQRRFTNYLSTQKVSYIQSVANLTGKILDWRRGNFAHPAVARIPNSRHINAKKSHQKLIHTFESMRPEILTAAKEGVSIRSKFPRSAPDTVFAFAYLYFGRLDPYKRDEFFHELTQQPASTEPTYPIRALEKTLTSRAGEKGIHSYTWLSWMFLTWNEWQLEQPLSRDRFRNLPRPRWDRLHTPVDPHADEREEGWQPL